MVATDDAENWLLMGDLGKTIIGDEPVAAGRLGSLRRPPSSDAGWVGPMSWRRPASSGAAWPSLPRRSRGCRSCRCSPRCHPDPRDRLEAAIPRLVEACERLSAIGPAETIVHGDLHPWNVADVDGRPIVFDWSDSCIGHPFLDLATYVGRTP